MVWSPPVLLLLGISVWSLLSGCTADMTSPQVADFVVSVVEHHKYPCSVLVAQPGRMGLSEAKKLLSHSPSLVAFPGHLANLSHPACAHFLHLEARSLGQVPGQLGLLGPGGPPSYWLGELEEPDISKLEVSFDTEFYLVTSVEGEVYQVDELYHTAPGGRRVRGQVATWHPQTKVHNSNSLTRFWPVLMKPPSRSLLAAVAACG